MSTEHDTITATLNLQQQLVVSSDARRGSPEHLAHLVTTAQVLLGQQLVGAVLDPLRAAFATARLRAHQADARNPWAATDTYRRALDELEGAVNALGGDLLGRVTFTYGAPRRHVATLGHGDVLTYKGETFVGPAVIWEPEVPTPESPSESDTPHYRTGQTGLDDEVWEQPRPAPGTAQHLLWLRQQRERQALRERQAQDLARFLDAEPEGPRPDRAAAYDRATTPKPGAPRHD